MTPTIEKIYHVLARRYGVSPVVMIGENRMHGVVHARHIAMYLAMMLLGDSTTKIGKAFGGRDHSTVSHALRKVRRRLMSDEGYVNEIHQSVLAISRDTGAYHPASKDIPWAQLRPELMATREQMVAWHGSAENADRVLWAARDRRGDLAEGGGP